MNLHVFADAVGYNLNLVIGHCKELNALDKNIFLNLNTKPVDKNPNAFYIETNHLSFKRKIRTLPKLQSVTFCPFDFTAAYFLRELKRNQPGIQANWVFWSYEFYHQPHKYPLYLENFSLDFYKKENTFLKRIITEFKRTIKKILGIPVYNKNILAEGYKSIDNFYSFLPQDYQNVFINNQNKIPKYHFISFISLDQITLNIESGKSLTDEIIIGHAPRLTGNHAEVLQRLSQISFSNLILIPLEYGNNAYGNEIKEMAIQYFNEQVSFLENGLEMQKYFQRLSKIGFAIFNFKNQEGLGNIVFLLWNGAKIFLQKTSGAYKQFKILGCVIFSLEDDLNEGNLKELLNEDDTQKNKAIIENLISQNKVKEYWRPLMQ